MANKKRLFFFISKSPGWKFVAIKVGEILVARIFRIMAFYTATEAYTLNILYQQIISALFNVSITLKLKNRKCFARRVV